MQVLLYAYASDIYSCVCVYMHTYVFFKYMCAVLTLVSSAKNAGAFEPVSRVCQTFSLVIIFEEKNWANSAATSDCRLRNSPWKMNGPSLIGFTGSNMSLIAIAFVMMPTIRPPVVIWAWHVHRQNRVWLSIQTLGKSSKQAVRSKWAITLHDCRYIQWWRVGRKASDIPAYNIQSTSCNACVRICSVAQSRHIPCPLTYRDGPCFVKQQPQEHLYHTKHKP